MDLSNSAEPVPMKNTDAQQQGSTYSPSCNNPGQMNIEVMVDSPRLPSPNDIAIKSEVVELPEKVSSPITDNSSALEISRPVDTNINVNSSKMEIQAKDNPSYIPVQIKQEDEVQLKMKRMNQGQFMVGSILSHSYQLRK